MSQRDQEHRQYDYLESLSIERLEEQLYQCGEDNPELLDRIVEVIVKKEKEDPSGRLMDIDTAWAEFKTHYMTSDKADLHCNGSTKRRNAAAVNSEDPPESLQPKRRHSALMRSLLSSAAVIAVIFAGMIVVQAAGFDVFSLLARWTDEVLQFTGNAESSQADKPSVADITDTSSSLQVALVEKGISGTLAPIWFPSEFDMGEIKSTESKVFNKVSCRFSNGEEAFEIQFILYKEVPVADPVFYEKDSDEVEEYVSNSRLFYIVSNVDQRTATWADGDISIKISGNISDSSLKKIVDSIGG